MIRILSFLLLVGVACAAQDPRSVAEEAIAAWRDGDAKRLEAVAHSELKKRCRDARIVQFYVEGKEEKKKALSSGSDTEAMVVFCEALRAIVPRDNRVDYFDRYVEVVEKPDRAIVVFESGWRQKGDSVGGHSMKFEVVLKKVGAEWRFLRSPAAQIHIDLEWDPR